MKITIEVELRGSIRSWDDVVKALSCTAGTLADSSQTLEPGIHGFVFNNDAEDVGQFIVMDRSIRDFAYSTTEEVFE